MKELYLVIHTHRFGTSVWVVRSEFYPTTKQVVEACGVDFEPDRGDETLEIEPAGKIIDIQ